MWPALKAVAVNVEMANQIGEASAVAAEKVAVVAAAVLDVKYAYVSADPTGVVPATVAAD